MKKTSEKPTYQRKLSNRTVPAPQPNGAGTTPIPPLSDLQNTAFHPPEKRFPIGSLYTGEILQRERSFTKDGKVYWFTEEPGLSSFVFPTSEGSELTIHHESLANVINGSLISFTMDGDVIHCVSAREKHSNEAQYLSSFNLNDIAKHAGLWLIPRHF